MYYFLILMSEIKLKEKRKEMSIEEIPKYKMI